MSFFVLAEDDDETNLFRVEIDAVAAVPLAAAR